MVVKLFAASTRNDVVILERHDLSNDQRKSSHGVFHFTSNAAIHGAAVKYSLLMSRLLHYLRSSYLLDGQQVFR